jgi:hypothetical protein
VSAIAEADPRFHLTKGLSDPRKSKRQQHHSLVGCSALELALIEAWINNFRLECLARETHCCCGSDAPSDALFNERP